ncbi:MAG TPA: ABC transporter permease [Mycobacteriales bacterium]|nr:ABC transporter permease [Mycobacteriales bacterium]
MQFLVLGLGAGAVYAALGLGLVLTHRASGVVNFAHGAMAMYPTYVFAELRDNGDLVLPLVTVDLGDTVGLWPALLAGLLVAAVLGLLAYVLIFRPLRHAPALARVVATVGLLITLQAFITLRFGTDNRSVTAVLPSDPITMGAIVVPRDRLYLAVIVVLAAFALWALFRFTRFGLATRAASANEKGAALLGYSPELLAGINWVLATVLAGLAGILVGPITALDPVNYTLLVVPALGAALVGRFSSFGVTTAAALLLGMMQSQILNLQTELSWIPRSGTREALPFLLIVVTMAVVGRRLPSRDAILELRQPRASRPENVLRHTVIWSVLASAGLLFLSGGYRGSLIISLNVAVLCLSLVVLTGYVGQISLAQMAFAGTAGFLLSRFADNMGIPFPLSPLLAVAVAVVLGLLVGLPALRVRGVNLAVVTIALGVAVSEFVFKNPDYTGGFEGSKIPQPSLFGLGLGSGNDRVFGFFSLAVLVLVALAVANLRRSPTGLRMLAVRANERAAAAAGVSPARVKLLAFALSAGIAGIGGVMLGYRQTQLSFESFGIFVSLAVLATAYLGGIASVSGAMVGGSLAAGGIVFYALEQGIGFGRYETLVSGLGLVLTAVLNPEGISGAMQHTVAQLRGRGGTTPPPPATPSQPADLRTEVSHVSPA